MEKMTFDAYQTECARPTKADLAGHKEDIAYLSVGFAGEAGEVCNDVKKFLRGDFGLDELRRRVRDESGDVLFYLSRLNGLLGTSFGDVAKDNLEKIERVNNART